MRAAQHTAGGERSQRPQRICSLLPSATEIVAALGLTDCLVGVSAECDWPAEVRDLPTVSASRIDTAALPAREIDREVREAIADGRSLYAVDRELIERLDPDLILTQDLCAVCAVPSGELSSLGAIRAETLSLDARSVAEIEGCVARLAERLGVPERGRRVITEMRERIGRVRQLTEGLRHPRVFVSEWLDPPFAAGHWVPEMASFAGGSEVLGRTGEASFRTTWARVQAAAPELVVLAPCGLDARRAAREAQLPALDCPAVAVDANAYFSRPSPRVADGVAQLGYLLHPEMVPDPSLPFVELG